MGNHGRESGLRLTYPGDTARRGIPGPGAPRQRPAGAANAIRAMSGHPPVLREWDRPSRPAVLGAGRLPSIPERASLPAVGNGKAPGPAGIWRGHAECRVRRPACGWPSRHRRATPACSGRLDLAGTGPRRLARSSPLGSVLVRRSASGRSRPGTATARNPRASAAAVLRCAQPAAGSCAESCRDGGKA